MSSGDDDDEQQSIIKVAGQAEEQSHSRGGGKERRSDASQKSASTASDDNGEAQYLDAYLRKSEDPDLMLTKIWQQLRQANHIIIIALLFLIGVVSFSVRIFSVLRYESVIHEYDPWFNFRSTKFLHANGVYEFWNWFDNMAWYPLGRNVGGTVYPGIMFTAAFQKWVLDFLSFPVDIRNICVFTAPVFSVL